jgi:acetate---CoA ligase (ADP-forming)
VASHVTVQSNEPGHRRPIERPDAFLPADLFNPRSIAILGASGERGRLAHRPLDYLRRMGYPGEVYPINLTRSEIEGWACRRDLAEVDGPIDVALISLPAAQVPATLVACAARGVKLAVVLTAGAEAELPPPPGLLVIGPNCMGFMNAGGRVGAAWSSSLDLPSVKPGRVGLISQSGGLGGGILNRLQDRGVGQSYAFWSGSELQIDACDLLHFLLDDPDTSVIAMLVEGLRRPRRFRELAALALERGKPIVVLKMAQSAAGAQLAIAHTGILAGAADSYRAAFRQDGVIEVREFDELVDTAALLSRADLPQGDGLGMISSSGGATLLVADICNELGVRLPELAPDTKADIAAMLPSYAPVPSNPLDITAGLSEAALFQPLERLALDPSIDLVLNVVTMIGGASRLEERAAGLLQAPKRVSKPVVSCWTSGGLGQGGMEMLAAADLPFYSSPENCIRGIKALFDYARRRREADPAAQPSELDQARDQVRAAILAHREAGRKVLDEREAAPLLAAYGLPLTPTRIAVTVAEAVTAAEAVGFPVVLKADVAGLAHKARVGGVRVGLADVPAVAGAFEGIRAALLTTELATDYRGVLVQQEAPAGVEAVLGLATDAQFGPKLVLGLGGAFAESLAQVAVRLPPLRPRDAEELIDETPLRRIPGRAALLAAALRLSQFAVDMEDLVAECDLNPIRLYADRALALDALIVLH